MDRKCKAAERYQHQSRRVLGTRESKNHQAKQHQQRRLHRVRNEFLCRPVPKLQGVISRELRMLVSLSYSTGLNTHHQVYSPIDVVVRFDLLGGWRTQYFCYWIDERYNPGIDVGPVCLAKPPSRYGARTRWSKYRFPPSVRVLGADGKYYDLPVWTTGDFEEVVHWIGSRA